MARTRLVVGCELRFTVDVPTPMVFMLRPQSGPLQAVVREEYMLLPRVDLLEVNDSFGNVCQRLVAPVGEFVVKSEAEVLVSKETTRELDAGFVPVQELPGQTLEFLLPSRYCESDRFGNMALQIVGDLPPGYAQVDEICKWVRANIVNTPLSSTFPVSATEVNQRGEGVCRDLAHVAISLCRALCIPARLAVGYLDQLEPMDIHAWIEAYVGDRWYAFDPSIGQQDHPRVTIARGRDATDVAIYNQYGPLLLPQAMHVSVTRC